MAKSVSAGPATFSVSVSNGVVDFSAKVGGALGGGQAAGVVSASGGVDVQLNAAQAGDLGLALLAEAVPSLSAEIAVLKAAYDAEIAKLSV